MLQKSWMLGEIIILAMFENEDAALVQKVTIQNEVWNLWEFLQSVRWIGKDEIKLLLAGSQEAEHIATNQKILVFAQLLETLADEVAWSRSASTLMTRWQPRETSSSEMLPVPAKRSRAVASSKSM